MPSSLSSLEAETLNLTQRSLGQGHEAFLRKGRLLAKRDVPAPPRPSFLQLAQKLATALSFGKVVKWRRRATWLQQDAQHAVERTQLEGHLLEELARMSKTSELHYSLSPRFWPLQSLPSTQPQRKHLGLLLGSTVLLVLLGGLLPLRLSLHAVRMLSACRHAARKNRSTDSKHPTLQPLLLRNTQPSSGINAALKCERFAQRGGLCAGCMGRRTASRPCSGF